MGERVVLIDGTGLAYRAYHALPNSLKTTTGVPTNATFGFAQMFRKVLAGRTPAMGAVVFDAPGGTFRNEVSSTYKASRPPMPQALRKQLPYLERLVKAHNFPILRVPGVEADDVIATLTRRALDAGHEVWIVSGDKDFRQLIGDRVRQLDSTKEVLYDADLVFRRTGVRPEQFVDWLALVGDAVDDIAGVPGIGPKGAAKLLQNWGSLDSALQHAAEIGGRVGTALQTHREQALQSRQLAALRTDLPLVQTLDELVLVPPTVEQLNAVYLELEFWSLLSAEAQAQLDKTQATYFVCDTLQMATAALQHETAGPEPVALHVLYELPDPLRGEVTGLAISPELGRGVYLPVRGAGSLGTEVLELARPWLEDPDKPKVAHEHKRAYVALRRLGIELRGVVGDSALASYLVDPTRTLPHRIEQVAREYLHVALQPIRGVIGRGGRDRRAFAELTIDKAGAYACHLADAAGAAWHTLRPLVRDEGHAALLAELDLPLSRVLGRLELRGIRADRAVLDRLGAELQAERDTLTEHLHTLAGRPFNPGSHKQLGAVLFEELGLPVHKRTKTGYSVAADVLERLADQHPIIGVVLRWRTVDKLINTYTEVLAQAISDDGRIHTTFQQTVSASGRLITTEPDLQRTPVRTEEFRQLREAFVARDGCQLISADWSQIELRILAHVTGDARLGDAYRQGRDVHRQTAAELLGRREAEVTSAQRELGKTVNFATIYGQGAAALGRQLGVSSAEARGFLQTFFATYAGVAAWRERVVTQAYADGYVRTLLGRRRYVTELSSNDPTQRAYGERIATNTPIQGSGADLCKKAMLDIDRALSAAGLQAAMVLQIHDEIVVEAPDAEVDRACDLVRSCMEQVHPLDVPLVVDIGVGPTWADAH